jgi:hypothetical protein
MMEVLLQNKNENSTAINNGGTVKSFWINEFENDDK